MCACMRMCDCGTYRSVSKPGLPRSWRMLPLSLIHISLRGCMVQLYKNDMRVNLPAPLHLAEQVEEYIWDWELTGRR